MTVTTVILIVVAAAAAVVEVVVAVIVVIVVVVVTHVLPAARHLHGRLPALGGDGWRERGRKGGKDGGLACLTVPPRYQLPEEGMTGRRGREEEKEGEEAAGHAGDGRSGPVYWRLPMETQASGVTTALSQWPHSTPQSPLRLGVTKEQSD